MNIFIVYIEKLLIIATLGFGIYFVVNIGNNYVDENKKIKITRRKTYNILIFIIITILLFLTYRIVQDMTSLFMAIFIAIIFAYVMNPLVNILERKGIKRTWGILLIYLVIGLLFFFLSFSLIPSMVKEFGNLFEDLPTYFTQLSEFLNDLYNVYSERIENLPVGFKSIDDSIKNSLTSLETTLIMAMQNVTDGVVNIFSKVFTLVLIPVLTFYFLQDKDYFKEKITLMIPKKYRKDILKVAKEINEVLSKFIRGQIIIAIFVGVATTIGLWILKVKFALIIGLIAGIADVIPYFGPIIGVIPAVIFALLDKPMKVVWVIIVFIIIQQFESDILSPKIVGNSVGLHPVIVMIALLIGGTYFGVLGMLLAVPVAAISKVISHFVVEKLYK